jgi:hypothetical protein
MRSFITLACVTTVACGGADIHATASLPPPPEAHVEVHADAPPPPPPPQATVTVQTAPPPTATVVVQTAPPPPPPATVTFTVVPEPQVRVFEMRYAVADGRPAGLHSGAPEAFWVWHDERGRFWHVRSTTAGMRHRFQGAVISDGVITNVNATDHSYADRIRADAKSVNFDFFTQGNEDGFDFRVAGSQCVRFYMTVDGRSEPNLVHIGRGNAHPGAWHFKLCP